VVLKTVNTILKLLFILITSSIIMSCATESTTVKQKSSPAPITSEMGKDELKQESNIDPKTSGTGKEELLKWFGANLKYASILKGLTERREQQINFCIEKKIPCKWLIGSGITNSQKGYVVTFKDNEFTIEEFPAGKESEYGIAKKDLYFKTR
jgi:hypothetical protein